MHHIAMSLDGQQWVGVLGAMGSSITRFHTPERLQCEKPSYLKHEDSLYFNQLMTDPKCFHDFS